MNKKEAADFLGISTRLVERYVSQGRLHVTYVRGKTGKEASFEENDLERLKRELETPVHRAIVAPPNTSEAGPVGALVPAVQERQERLINALETIVTYQANGRHHGPVPIESKPLLKLKEAQALTGISRNALIEAIESGKLKAAERKDHRAPYRVKRSALDVFIEKNY